MSNALLSNPVPAGMHGPSVAIWLARVQTLNALAAKQQTRFALACSKLGHKPLPDPLS